MSTTTLFFTLPSSLIFWMSPILETVPELNLSEIQSMSLTIAKPLST